MLKRTAFTKKHGLILTIIAAGVLIAVGLIAYRHATTERNASPHKAHTSLPDREDVLTIEGKVTMKRRSCGAESIDPDEDVRKYAICDSGQGVRVDDKIFITTSSSGPGPGFHVSTDSIDLGDSVLVKYVIDDTYGPSLNCSKCSFAVVQPSR